METKNKSPLEGSHNPLERLKAAYEALNQFIYKREKQKCKFPLKSVFAYFLSLFSKDYRENLNKKKLLDQKRFRELRDVIQTHSPAFTLLEQGSPEQKKLAKDVKEAVKKFNQQKKDQNSGFKKLMEDRLESKEHTPITLHHRLTKQKMVISQEFVNKLLSGSFRDPISSDYKPTQNDLDRFKLKAKKLMEEEGLMPESIREILKSPIQYKIGEVVQEEKTQSLIEFRLRFAQLGDEVEVKGTFLRELKPHAMYTIPIPESFRMVYKSTQTGFPSPEIHTGVAAAYWLIPAAPLRLEELGKLGELYEKRNLLAEKLFNQEEEKAKARDLFKKKKQDFFRNKEAYIENQKRLCLAIISAAPEKALLDETEKSIHDFFSILPHYPCAYDRLADVFQQIIELFLEEPYMTMQKAWLEGKESAFLDSNPEVRAHSLSSLFKNEIQKALELANQKMKEGNEQDKISWNFIKCIGFLFGTCSEAIFLLEQSEKFHFKPPMLTDFETSFMAFAFKQMVEFFDDMTGSNPSSLMQQIESDIKIFTTGDSQYEDFVVDIESYYHGRYHKSYQ